MPKTETAVGQGSSKRVEGTGVGAGKFLGVRKIFARIFPNLPEKQKVFRQLFVRIFSPTRIMRTFSEMTSNAIFSKQTTFGAIFVRIFRKFAQILWDFVNTFNDFAQIFIDFVPIFGHLVRIFDKWKHLRVRLHLLHPRLLHHWLKAMKSLKSFYLYIQYTCI